MTTPKNCSDAVFPYKLTFCTYQLVFRSERSISPANTGTDKGTQRQTEIHESRLRPFQPHQAGYHLSGQQDTAHAPPAEGLGEWGHLHNTAIRGHESEREVRHAAWERKELL